MLDGTSSSQGTAVTGVLVDDVVTRFDEGIDTPADGAVRPLVCIPIKVRGKILGVLRAFPEDRSPAVLESRLPRPTSGRVA